jgi:hypothetical protein
MPSFELEAQPPINALGAYYDSQKSSLANQGAQQTLTDRATLRGLAPGLATRDPNAVAGAAVLPDGSNAVNSLTALDAARAQQALAQATLQAQIPQVSGAPVSGAPPPAAPGDGSAPPGGDGIAGNPLLGPLPSFDLAGRPPATPNGPGPGGGTQPDMTQPPGPDHPALPAIRQFAAKIMAVPSEQRPALYQTMLPAMKQAGAIHAPDQYPGDDAVSHLASGGAVPPVQVAGPGAPTAPTAPSAAPLAAAAQPPIPNQNPMLAVAAPDGAVPAAPLNTLAEPPPQTAPMAPRPQLMPAASAAPPASAQPATGAQPPAIGTPPNGARLLTIGLGQLPYTTGAQPGNAWYQLPDGTRQQFRDPAQPQTLTHIDSGTERRWYGPGGNLVKTETIDNKDRSILANVPGGQQVVQDGKLVGPVIPYSGRPEQADAYKADLPRAEALTTAAQSSQASMPRLNEMAELIPQLATGPTGELRAKGAALLESAGASPQTIKAWTGMSSGAQAQELIKYSISTAGAAAKADVGANNGIQSTQLYQSANPGILLLPDANKHVTNMLRMSAQQIQDYAQAALQHFGTNESAFLSGGNYAPLTTFNRQWLAQNNPQIGAATIGILNGDPFAKWSAGISKEKPEDAAAAVAMAARIDPNVMVQTRGGIPQRATDMLAHPKMPAPPSARTMPAAPPGP